MLTHSDTILVVEDDPDIAVIEQSYLEQAGYTVVMAKDGREALNILARQSPKLIVLDWMLPEIDGLDLLTHIRSYSNVAVIMVTAKRQEENRILGLELGADDYLTKPFSPRELLARVKAVLRRTAPSEDLEILKRGRMEIRPHQRRILFDGKDIEITSLEFDLLHTLAKNPGRVFERDVLLELVWGTDYEGVDRVVDVHIYNLRKKLTKVDSACAAMIKTVWRIGYKFLEDS